MQADFLNVMYAKVWPRDSVESGACAASAEHVISIEPFFCRDLVYWRREARPGGARLSGRGSRERRGGGKCLASLVWV